MRTRPTILFFSPEGFPGARPGAAVGDGERLCPATGVRPGPGRGRGDRAARAPCLLFVDGNGTPSEGVRLVRGASARRVHGHCAGDGARRRSPCGAGAGMVRRRGGRSDHGHLLAGGTAVAARRDAGAHGPGRLGDSSTRLPGAVEIEAEVGRRLESEMAFVRVLRRPRPLQGIQRPVQVLRRRPRHLLAFAHSPRRREGAARPGRLGRAYRRRRLHLYGAGRRDRLRSAARSWTCSTR